jgi:uncharacterized protein (DUF1015 family)
MKIFPFQATYPNTELMASSDSFFATVREDFLQYQQSGFFRQAKEKAYYIFEIQSGKKVHAGLVVCLDVTDYSAGKIVKHEQTIASNEQEMLKVLLMRGAMVKPVLVCHPEIKEITREINKLKKKRKPFLDIKSTLIPNEYRLYQIPEKEGQELARLYKNLVPKVYIADGHHRCSTGEKLFKLQGNKNGKDYAMILSALFPFDQLDILDYNRIVHLPHNLKLTRFIADVSNVCDIKPLKKPAKPRRKHDITMCIQDHWFLLKWKDEVIKKYRKLPAVLDAHLLNTEILEGILGISDPRNDERIEYIPGHMDPAAIEEKASISDQVVGFCVYPVQFDELVKISDAGGTLPPKSTWFEPRMLNGLIVKTY